MGECYFCGAKAKERITFFIPANNSYRNDFVCEKDKARAEWRNRFAKES